MYRHIPLGLVLAASAPATLAYADDADPVEAAAAAAEAEAEPPSRGSASAGVDVTNHYYFRGIVQETDGVIVQPAAELGLGLYEGEGALHGIGLTTGLWSSLHSSHETNPSGPEPWYEADYYAGLSAGFAGGLEVGTTYTAYTSPNGSFGTVHELSVGVGWDDSGLWQSMMGGRFGGIAPSVTVAFELDNTAFGDDEGVYVEAGVGPSVTLFESDAISLGAAVPLTVGSSASDYFIDASGNNDAFGFFDAGLTVSAGLGFIPSEYGEWSVGVGGHVLLLGDGTGDAAEAAGGDDTELIATGSLSASY